MQNPALRRWLNMVYSIQLLPWCCSNWGANIQLLTRMAFPWIAWHFNGYRKLVLGNVDKRLHETNSFKFLVLETALPKWISLLSLHFIGKRQQRPPQQGRIIAFQSSSRSPVARSTSVLVRSWIAHARGLCFSCRPSTRPSQHHRGSPVWAGNALYHEERPHELLVPLVPKGILQQGRFPPSLHGPHRREAVRLPALPSQG